MADTFNKDFYVFIPLWIRNKLDMKILLYRNEPWFVNGWEEYRKHCMKTRVEEVMDPDFFFIKKEKESNEMKSSEEGGEAFTEDISRGFPL